MMQYLVPIRRSSRIVKVTSGFQRLWIRTISKSLERSFTAATKYGDRGKFAVTQLGFEGKVSIKQPSIDDLPMELRSL
jgi:hypothetical protein